MGDIQDRKFLEELPSDLLGKFDKIFSSATLHWCSRDPLSVLVNVHDLLKGGGLFVAEMGGEGNIASMTPGFNMSKAMEAENTIDVQVLEMPCTWHCTRGGSTQWQKTRGFTQRRTSILDC